MSLLKAPEYSPENATIRPLLRVEEIKRHFPVARSWLSRLIAPKRDLVLKAVDGVRFEIRPGETFALVGESGSGKSTIAKIVVGLYEPTEGSVFFEDIDIAGAKTRKKYRTLQSRMQMIFQDPYASLNPRWRVWKIIAEPIETKGLVKDKAEIRSKVDDLLKLVGLGPADAERFPHEFSGGQRQRISIARALAGEPELLICDEPTSALDVSVQAQILNLMRRLQKRLGLTYLFISHNMAVVHFFADRVGVLYLGRLVEWGDTKTLFKRPKHPYTRMLMDAIPDVEMVDRERSPIPGEVPSPIDPPRGCAFHPRCPFANERCWTETPRAVVADNLHVACHAVEEGRLE